MDSKEPPMTMLGDELNLVERRGVVHRVTEVAAGGVVEVETHGQLELECLGLAAFPFVNPRTHGNESAP